MKIDSEYIHGNLSTPFPAKANWRKIDATFEN